jgi:xylulokinase
LLEEKPVLDPIITNVLGVTGGWAAFTILDAGGDAMRWARRAFHEKTLGYDQIVRLAESVMLVGQAPGAKEPLLGHPFAWTAGKAMFKWFKEELGVTGGTLR